MKAADIAIHQQKLLVAFAFVQQYEAKVSNLHDMHNAYLNYCRNKLTIRYAFGKFYFAGLIQKFGVRRCRTTGPSIWRLPEEFEPDDLINVIQEETERLINQGAGREKNFDNLK